MRPKRPTLPVSCATVTACPWPTRSSTPCRATAPCPRPAQGGAAPTAIDQVNSQFPFITPVRRGSSVVFRNADTYGHTVYSVSQTKVFNIPLSRDVVSAPVVFDTAGVVIVGCSIHDYMLAYILVLDTPYYAVTNATGTAILSNLPADTHDVSCGIPA